MKSTRNEWWSNENKQTTKKLAGGILNLSLLLDHFIENSKLNFINNKNVCACDHYIHIHIIIVQ
jgi:hypothetical protein